MRPIIAAIVLFACTAIAGASEFVLKDGYYFKHGGTQAYERYTEWDYVSGYYRYDSYACRYVWVPAYYQGRYAYRPVKLDLYADDFATQALKVAAARDKFVLTSQANLALVDKLGLNFAIPNYGVGIFPGYARAHLPAYEATLYSQVADIYGTTDVNAIFQQASRLVERSQDLAATGDGNFSQRLAQVIDGQERVALQREKTKALAVAVAPVPQARLESKSATIGPARIQGAVGAVRLAAANACVSCHGEGGQAVKSFDVSKYDPATADAALIERVFRYVRPGSDPHCPPGKQLTADQINELTLPRKE